MALPFDLPRISRGFAALTPAARAAGGRALDAAASALAPLLGQEVSIRARPVPGTAPRAGIARVALELAALPAAATLEIDPGLVVALVDVLAGGRGVSPRATALTPIEASALDLLVLAALDGACSIAELEESLAPRLSRDAAGTDSALAIELDIAAGPAAGRGRLLVPAAAVRLLGQRGEAADEPGGAIPIPLSLREGRAPLSSDELAALAPGDVVLLDRGPAALVAPGGARLIGRIEEGRFLVEEVTMTTRAAELHVTLEVELARMEVLLADLVRLEPGSAMPLAIDRRGIVTLRVGERAIGRGELVDVDGAIGVRVVALEGQP